MLQGGGSNACSQALLLEVYTNELSQRQRHTQRQIALQRRESGGRKTRSRSRPLSARRETMEARPIGWGVPEGLPPQRHFRREVNSYEIARERRHQVSQSVVETAAARRIEGTSPLSPPPKGAALILERCQQAKERRPPPPPSAARTPLHGVAPPFNKKSSTKDFYDTVGGIACLFPLVRELPGESLAVT